MRIYPGTTVDYEFAELGTAGFSGTLNDRQFAFLRNASRTGALPDMMYQHANDTDPYSQYTAAYDFRTATGYLLNTGKIETVYNLGNGGSAYDATQVTALDRPTVGAMTDAVEAAVFTSAEEWLTATGLLAEAMNAVDAALRVTIIFESNNTATQQTLLCWSAVGSSNDYQIIATDGTGDIRLTRRDSAGVTTFAVDSAVKFTTNTTYTLTLEFGGGLVSGYLNGDIAFTDVNYISTTGAIAANQFVIGSRLNTAATFGWEGEIAFVGIELL